MKLDIPNLHMYVRSASFKARVPFSNEQMALLIGNLSAEFHNELPESSSNEKQGTYSLRNGESEVKEQMSIIIGSANISFLWTQEQHEKTVLERLCRVCENSIPHLPKLLAFIDTEYFFDFEVKESHYELIHTTYFMETPFAAIIKEGRKNLTNDISYRLSLENDTILVITVEGSQNDSEIINGKMDKSTLRIRLSLGRHKGLGECSLEQLFKEHLKYASQLVVEELIQAIVLPLAKNIKG